MRLHTRHTYSLEISGPVPHYPALTEDRDVEVLVLGGGISGALTAWALQEAGTECLIIDKRAVGTGSTAASTSLLQYELDTPLHELVQRMGADKAKRSYVRCYEALTRLEAICKETGAADLFEWKSSLQFASTVQDLDGLKDEYRLRKALGFDVELLGATELEELFFLKKPGGLLSGAGGQIDAFALTHHLLKRITERGGGIHGHTEAVRIDRHREGVTVYSESGVRIRARYLVIACGYESQRYLPKKVEDLYVTYALVSEPISSELTWHRHSLIWETAKPYLYLRGTSDHRILIGGKDTPFDGRTDFPLCRSKAEALAATFWELMPRIPFEPAYSWAGIFASTADGLPYIGTFAGQPNTYYALGFGGNGILFSVLAADIICGLIRNGGHPDAALFSFDRA